MNLTKRLEAIEQAVAKQSGENCPKVVFLETGETEERARERLGLTGGQGKLIFVRFVSPSDAAI